MEWITTWINGISDTWLRVFALLSTVGLALGAYQLITGWRARRLQKERDQERDQDSSTIKDFLFQKFGKRAEIRGHFKAQRAEMTASVGVRRKKKPSALLTLRRWWYRKVKDR